MVFERYELPEDDMGDLSTVRIDAGNPQIYVGISSVIGSRKEQQDSVKADSEYVFTGDGRGIAVLCDGMGGLSGGEKASQLCVSTVFNAFHELTEDASIPRFYADIVNRADALVSELKNSDGKPLHAGTTLVSVAIDCGKLYWTSVGDSRIYIRRGDEIACFTRDHNLLMLLNEKVKRGEIRQEEADSNPKREALVSYIGMGGLRYADRNNGPFLLEPGDQIILCSDGLYRTLTEGEIMEVTRCFAGSADSAAEALTQLAISKCKPHQDNTSVIVLEYDNGR